MALAVMAIIGKCLKARVGSDDAGRLDAVHDRHLHVHQDDVVVVVADHAQGHLAVFREIDERLGIFELAHGDFLIDLVVLDEQDARATHGLNVEGRNWLLGLDTLAVGAQRHHGCIKQNGGGDRFDEDILKATFLRLFQHFLAAVGRHHHKMGREWDPGEPEMRLPVSMPFMPGICQSTKAIS